MKKEVMCLYGTGFNDLVPIRSTTEKEFSAFVIDETVIQISNQNFWLWFCIETIHRSVLGIYISKERNMLIAEKFIRTLVEKYGRHPVYTDGSTWYDEACNIIGLKHYLHSSIEKSLMERVNQYFKDRIENLLIITIRVCKLNTIYFMYITGYNSLYLCIIIQ
jgi:transposase-like protein